MKRLILIFASKYRICRRYSPDCGTWYVIQFKFLWNWFTLNYAFDELSMANQYISYIESKANKVEAISDTICETPLSRGDCGIYVEKYPCNTYHINL